MTTAESFDPAARPTPPYLRAVPDGERAPRIDLTDDEFASFARSINDARGWDLIPVEPAPVDLPVAALWARIARLEEDREALSSRCDTLQDTVDGFEATALRMRALLDPLPPYAHDVWHMRAVLAQLRDLLG